jgi:hypothetical protein
MSYPHFSGDCDEYHGPSAVPPAELLDLLEAAWGVLANAGWDGAARPEGWQEAAERWRDRYHEVLSRALHPQSADEPAREDLPPGRYVRVEMPGYRTDTGWMTEETRAGIGVLVVRNWDGGTEAEVFPGPGCRVVALPTPLRRPEPEPALPALRPGTAASYSYDDGEDPF